MERFSLLWASANALFLSSSLMPARWDSSSLSHFSRCCSRASSFFILSLNLSLSSPSPAAPPLRSWKSSLVCCKDCCLVLSASVCALSWISAIIWLTSSSNCTAALDRASFLENMFFRHFLSNLIRVTASSLWASGFCLLDLILQARAALHSFMKVSSSKHAIAALRQLGKLSERSPRAPTPALAFMAARFLFGVWGRKPPAGFRPLMLSLLTSLMMDSRLITSTRALRSTMLGPVAAAPLFLVLLPPLDGVVKAGRSASAPPSAHATLLCFFCWLDRSCSREALRFTSLGARGSLPLLPLLASEARPSCRGC